MRGAGGRGGRLAAVLAALACSACGAGSAGPRPVAPSSRPPVPRSAPTSPVTPPASAALPSSQIGGTVAESAGPGSRLGPWTLVSHTNQLTPLASEGVATLPTAAGGVLYRGSASIPRQLDDAGWQHIGDPDAVDGYVLDAYQGAATATSKLYELTTPKGARLDYIHPLAPGELINNSFVAISPDRQWTVTGEWQVMRRLLVVPTPLLSARTPRPGAPLPLAGIITLDHAVRDVQSCDFVSAVRLVCATDDPDTDLWPVARQVLQVDLSRAPDGRDLSAHVTLLGPVPLRSACTGTFETEGVDVDQAGELRLEVVPPVPCNIVTTVYLYRRSS